MTQKPPKRAEPKYSLPINGRWLTYRESELRTMKERDSARYKVFEWRYNDFIKNRIKYFLPHGPIVIGTEQVGDVMHCRYRNDTKIHTGKQTSGALFVNDADHQIKLMLKPNQGGGTTVGAASAILRGIKTEPDWPCFMRDEYDGEIYPDGNGIRFFPWTGSKDILIAAYTWEKIGDTLWPEYMKLLPEREKTPYMLDLDVQRFVGGKVRFCETAYSGTKFHFKCYQQSQKAFSGQQFDYMHLDEQPPQNHFREAWRGVSSRWTEDFMPQAMFTLTGHVVDDNPDTGGGGWIKTDVYDGRDTQGCGVGVYNMTIASIPPEIMGKESKRQKYRQFIELPRKNQDMKKLREGEARYYGRWEVAGGLVFDAFDPRFNLIDHKKIPEQVWKEALAGGLYRAIDPGKNAPTAALWVAILRTGDVVCFREYYTRGLGIPRTAHDIVKASGNMAVLDAAHTDDYYRTTIEYHHEEFTGESYQDTLLDGRTFAEPSDAGGMTIGETYQAAGLDCRAAPGTRNSMHHPTLTDRGGILYVINEGFRKNEKRRHPVTGESPGCTIWIDYRLQHLIDEISTWRLITSKSTGEEKPDPKGNDHLIDCLKWIMAVNPYCDTRRFKQKSKNTRIMQYTPRRWGRGQFVR